MRAAFLEALRADGPAPESGENAELYGRFVGAWDLAVTRFLEDGSTRTQPGEWHFAWVLEGRAIQDVWIVPGRGPARDAAPASERYYGTTLRIWDPRIDAWRIQYADPASHTYSSMIGRAEGRDIIQTGRNEAGDAIRWSFRDIQAESFLWRGEVSTDDGRSWRTHIEFTAKRRTTA